MSQLGGSDALVVSAAGTGGPGRQVSAPGLGMHQKEGAAQMAAVCGEADAAPQLLLGQISGSSVVPETPLGQADGVWLTSHHLGPQPPWGPPHRVLVQVKLLGRDPLRGANVQEELPGAQCGEDNAVRCYPVTYPTLLATGRGQGLLRPSTAAASTDSSLSPALCSPEATSEGHSYDAKGRVTASLDPAAPQQEKKESLEGEFLDP